MGIQSILMEQKGELRLSETESEIQKYADFGQIRYAQLWEDADVLLPGLSDGNPNAKGGTLVSICAAGDNALAMLTLDPARIVTVDLSDAQIACLRLRIAGFKTLSHADFIELSGSRPSDQRGALLDKVAKTLSDEDQNFWSARKDQVIKYGFGGIGKFERFFRIFHSRILPLVQSRANIESVLSHKSKSERAAFLDKTWNHRRWRWMLKIFFSNFVMGRLGRDPAFFAHVEGSLSDHVAGRLEHAIVDLDPSQNPYLHWVLRGTHGTALPFTWREENFDVIRSRLDRLDIRKGSLEAFMSSGEKADGFNLSDIFEYMSEPVFHEVYESILNASNPGARLVYWDMMVPRRCPAQFMDRVTVMNELETSGKQADKAFFYSDFIVEQVR